jgi:hypothetical protein
VRGSIRLAAATVALVMLMPASASAGAIPPLGVGFDVQTAFTGPSGGPFTAHGVAVDVGWMCASGWTTDTWLKISGQTQGENYQVVKEFVCADGTGSFALKLQVRNDRKGDLYSWMVVGGDGNYASMHGSGSGYGDYWPDFSGVDDHLVGMIRVG